MKYSVDIETRTTERRTDCNELGYKKGQAVAEFRAVSVIGHRGRAQISRPHKSTNTTPLAVCPGFIRSATPPAADNRRSRIVTIMINVMTYEFELYTNIKALKRSEMTSTHFWNAITIDVMAK
ncbi:unnamed protein product [Colias eurytheme]|nr:unnamed protein product [Colias eurytheme]